MKHILLLLALLAIVPLAAAAPLANPLCLVEGYGCYEGYTQTECVDRLGLTFTYIDDDAHASYAQCTLGCCAYYNGAQLSYALENIMQTACVTPNVFDSTLAGACPAQFSQVVECAYDGDTDCRCSGNFIDAASGQICCGGAPTQGPTCGSGSTTPTPPNPFQNLCGNTVVDPVEECDLSAGGPNLCQEPPQGNACTALCRCAYTPGQYAGDNRCNPGESCAGTQSCTTHAPPPENLQAQITVGSPDVDISWTHASACNSERIEYEVLVVGTNSVSGTVTQRFSALAPSTTSQAVTLQPDFDYTVTVTVLYATGARKDASIPITAFAPECVLGVESWCDQTLGAVTCDAKNQMTNAPCSNPLACFMTSQGAQCLDAADCSACNGAYQNFGEVRASVSVPVVGIAVPLTCQALTQTQDVGGAQAAYCLLDYNQSALKQYLSCSDIQLCADYQTQATCESNANGCQLPMTCTWSTTGNLCTTSNPQFQRCSDATNSVECSAIGACFWTNTECIAQGQITCADYQTETSCTGTTASFERDVNTNNGNPYSADLANLRKCVWGGAALGCYKDSNDDGLAELGANQLFDFDDPVTTITSDLQLTYTMPVELEYGTSEPVTYTYAKLYNENCDDATWEEITDTTSADPTQGTMELYVPPADVVNGTYCVRYFSEDPARNMEIVQEANVTVNTDLQQLTITYTLFPNVDNTYVTIGLEFTTTRLESCTATIGTEDPPLNRAWFALSYYEEFRDIPTTKANVQVDVMCGAESESVLIPLAFDTRIQQPQPNETMLPTDSRAQTISIIAEDATSCQYDDNGWQNFVQSAPVNSTHYRWTATAPSTAEGYYEYPVRCTLNSLVVDGEAGDAVIYAIDETAPQLRTEATLFGSLVNLSGPVEVNATGLPFTVQCLDVNLPGGGNDWEAGCGEQATDLGGVYQVINGQRQKFTTQTARNVVLKQGEQYELIAVDELGNEGPSVFIEGVQPTDEVRLVSIEVFP